MPLIQVNYLAEGAENIKKRVKSALSSPLAAEIKERLIAAGFKVE